MSSTVLIPAVKTALGRVFFCVKNPVYGSVSYLVEDCTII